MPTKALDFVFLFVVLKIRIRKLYNLNWTKLILN